MKIVFVIGCCDLGEENVWHVWNVSMENVERIDPKNELFC